MQTRPHFAALSVVERLAPRLILDAPLALASEGLLLSAPEQEGLEASLFDAESEPVDLRPEDDPLSPVGDPITEDGDATAVTTSSCCGSCCTASYDCIVRMTLVTGDTYEFGETTGRFHFSAEACGPSGLPSSVTVYYDRTGTAAPTEDYSGSLATNDSVTIPLSGAGFNRSGTADREFKAVDDTLEEPNTPETVVVRMTRAVDTNSREATLALPSEATGTVASNDYTRKVLTASITVRRGDPIGKSAFVQLVKDGDPAAANGVKFTVVSVKTLGGEASAAVTTDPEVGESGFTARTTLDDLSRKDGIAAIDVVASPQGNEEAVRVTIKFEPVDATQAPETLEATFTVFIENEP